MANPQSETSVETLRANAFKQIQSIYNSLIDIYDNYDATNYRAVREKYTSKEELRDQLANSMMAKIHFAAQINLFTPQEANNLIDEYHTKRPDLFPYKGVANE